MFEVTLAAELVALFTGLIFYKKINPVVYRLMIPLLFITVINEALAYYGGYKDLKLDKFVFYNIFFLVEFIIIGIIFYMRSKKTIIFRVFYSGVIVLAAGILCVQGIENVSPDYLTVISFSLVLLSINYLRLLHFKNVFLRLQKDSIFFFSLGLIIAHLYLLFFINASRVESFRLDESRIRIFQIFNTAGNLFYYLLITYSFLCNMTFRKRDGI